LQASESHSLSRDGDEIYFETVGIPDAPVVVLGHGAGGNHAIWFQQVPVFAREYYVITWDQRGFGLSTNRNGLANPRTATADLLAILDDVGVARAHIVGQSLGGWAALGLAVGHADRVRTLVLADTLGGIPVEGWREARTIAPREGPFNHPALSNEFCVRNPERAHLYLEIGGLRRDPHADPTSVKATAVMATRLRMRSASTKGPAHDLAGGGLGEVVEEHDLAGYLVRGQTIPHVGLQLVGELVAGLLTGSEYDEGLGHLATPLVGRSDHRRHRHGGV